MRGPYCRARHELAFASFKPNSVPRSELRETDHVVRTIDLGPRARNRPRPGRGPRLMARSSMNNAQNLAKYSTLRTPRDLACLAMRDATALVYGGRLARRV